MHTLILAIIIGSVVIVNALTGALWQTGKQWIETCWEANRSYDAGNKAISAKDAIGREHCRNSVIYSLASNGFTLVSASYNKDPSLFVVSESCPYSSENQMWSEVVEGAIKRGNLSLIDYVAPSSWFVTDTLKYLYPNCPNARVQAKIPQYKVHKFRGTQYLAFDGKCELCEAADQRNLQEKKDPEVQQQGSKILTIEEVNRALSEQRKQAVK